MRRGPFQPAVRDELRTWKVRTHRNPPAPDDDEKNREHDERYPEGYHRSTEELVPDSKDSRGDRGPNDASHHAQSVTPIAESSPIRATRTGLIVHCSLGFLNPSQIDVLYRVPSPSLLEDTVPEKVRWWTERAEEFVSERQRSSERWKRTMRYILRSIPTSLARAGRHGAVSPRDLTEGDLTALKDSHIWAPSTLRTNLLVVRWFAKWSGNPLADNPYVWVTPHRAPTRRRWLTAEQLGDLWTGAHGRERLLVALEGFNGLRRIEVLRLRKRDLDLTLPNPTMNVLGKGRAGGKWRTIPVQQIAFVALVEASADLGPGDKLHPFHERTADHDLRAAAQRAGLGIRVSGHDLRRSFGRIAYQAGVSLVDLKYIYGHESVDMTAHCIGLDVAEAARGLSLSGRKMEAVMVRAGV